MVYTRFAVFYLPPPGALASFGAAWLGWDIDRGEPVAQPDIEGLDKITQRPAKYGFHATLKPPFHLSKGCTIDALDLAVSKLAAATAPARCGGLALRRFGRFLALAPTAETADLSRLAAACVTGLDRFRAPPPQAELARRRQGRLSTRQDAMLERWGYPYVMDEFRFHMTLTGPIPDAQFEPWKAILDKHLSDKTGPFSLEQIALVAERPDGRFERIKSYALTG
jgi:hypothetical protein